jgi:hypothetical protein
LPDREIFHKGFFGDREIVSKQAQNWAGAASDWGMRTLVHRLFSAPEAWIAAACRS